MAPPPPIIPEGPEWSMPNREVRGFTWRQLLWVIGSLAVVEFTLLGIYFSLASRVDIATSTNIAQNNDIHINKIDIETIRLKFERLDTRLDNIEREIYAKEHYDERSHGVGSQNNRTSHDIQ